METLNHQHYLDVAKYIVEASKGSTVADMIRQLDQHLRVAGYHLSQADLEKYIKIAQKESMLKTEKQLICIGIAKRIIKDNPHMIYSTLYNLVQHTVLLSGYDNTWFNVASYIEEARKELAKEKQENMKINITGTLTLEGAVNEVLAFCDKYRLGITGYYKSDTNGYMEIKSMNTQHIRNAVQKRLRNHIDNLGSLPLEQYKSALNREPDDREYVELVMELRKRS